MNQQESLGQAPEIPQGEEKPEGTESLRSPQGKPFSPADISEEKKPVLELTPEMVIEEPGQLPTEEVQTGELQKPSGLEIGDVSEQDIITVSEASKLQEEINLLQE